MRRRWIILPLLVALAGCGDPLAGVERVSEIEDLPVEISASAVPTEAEMNRDTPILAGLFRRSETQTAEAEDLTNTDTTVADTSPGPSKGSRSVETEAATSAANDIEASPDRSTGVMGWLRRAANAKAAAEAAAETMTEPEALSDGEAVERDAEPSLILASADPASTPKLRGLFGRSAAPKPPADTLSTRDVPFGATLAFGEIARVCDAKTRKLGKLVEQAARKGANYKLYDTNPDSAGQRTFYVTGFSDNCPRQFTAALALFGTPEFHEQLRYGLPAKEYPYSTTDRAYEKVKSQVCRVGRSKPCGPRISQLERTTVFVSTYENFTENARWADILIHEGEVLAAALKTP